MFSKRAKLKSLFKKEWSITARLTFFYTLSSLVIISSLAVFLFFTLTNLMYETEYQLLSHEVNKVANILTNDSENLRTLQQEVIYIPGTLAKSVQSEYRYYLRVLDTKSKIILSTAQMNERIPVSAFATKTFAAPAKTSQRWYSPQGHEYLLLETRVSNQNKTWLVQAAMSVTRQSLLIAQYRQTIIAALLTCLIFAVILGYLVALRSMRRLFELTEATSKITAHSLHQRINPSSWPEELSALGESFNQMLNRIEDSFKKLTHFSTELAHELRTPINNLLGEIEVTLSRQASVAEYQQILESNLEELQRLAQIIENLLFLTRVENPQLALQKEEIDFSKEIKLILEYYQAWADEKRIEMSSKGEAKAWVNPLMFRQLISNLLSNALKYTPAGGKIAFQLQTEPESVQLVLEDSGIGIEPEYLTRVFERFYRTEAGRIQHPRGFGLGLAIVKTIIDLHQGKIYLRSEVGKGTEIHISLPKKLENEG